MLGVLCTFSYFVRINPACRFPCTLCFQSLVLYYFLVGLRATVPKFRDRPMVVIEQGKTAERAFNAINRINNNMTTNLVFSYYKPNP
jgi:hypothetical protein